jgi:hypothetical protein
MTDKKGNIKGNWVSGSKHITIDLAIISFDEDDSTIIYCPALDVSGYGKTEKEALESFHIGLGEFFLYTTRKKTFVSELTRMGWKVKKSSHKPMHPPELSKLLETNDNFNRIFNQHAFRKFNQAIEMPLA